MKWKMMTNSANIVLPLIGIGLMESYEIYDITCSALKGSFLDMDLKYIDDTMTRDDSLRSLDDCASPCFNIPR